MATRAGKIISVSLASLFVLVVITALLALTAPVQTAVVHRLLAGFNRDIAGEIRVGRAHVTLRGAVVLRDVVLLDEGGHTVASFDSLRAVVDLAPLRRSFAHVRSLYVGNLQLNVSFDSTGTPNIERVWAAKTPRGAAQAEPSPWVIELDNAAIMGGTTRVNGTSGTLFQTESWQLRATGVYGHDSLSYDVTLAAQCGVQLDAQGSAVLGNPLQSADGRLEIALDSLFTARLPEPACVAGNVRAVVSYETRSDSLVAVSNLHSDVLGQVRADLAIPFPPSGVAGRASMILDRVRPGPILSDTTPVLINGRLDLTKVETRDIVDGWDAHVELYDSRYERYAIPAAYLDVTVHDSSAKTTGYLNTGQGHVRWNAELHGFDLPTARLRADLQCDRLYLHGLIPQVPDSLSPLTGRIHAEVESLDPDSAVGDVEVRMSRMSLGSIVMDSVDARAHLQLPAFRLDTLNIAFGESNFAARAEGARGGELVFAARLHIPDLADIGQSVPLPASADSLSGEVATSLTGRASLAGDSISHITGSGDVRLRAFHAGSVHVEQASLRIVEADLDSLRFRAALHVRDAGNAERQVDSLTLIVDGTPNDASGSLRLTAQSDTLRLDAEMRVHREADRTEIALRSFTANVYGVRWQLGAPTTVSLVGDHVDVDGLTVSSPLGVVRAAGTLARSGEQDLAVEVSGMETAELAHLFALPLPSTTVNVRLQVTGSDTALAGDFEMNADTVVLDGATLADEVQLRGTVDQSRAVISGMVRWLGDTLTVFSGDIPASISLAEGLALGDSLPINGHVRVIEQPLDKLNRYLPFGMTFGGFASGEISISGTPSKPQWLGNVWVRDGQYNDSRTGIRYHNIDVQGDFSADTLRISHFDMQSGGELSGSGWAVMALPLPSELHLDLNLNDFEAINGPIMQARASGNMAVNGPLNHLTAKGDLRFSSFLYRITQSASKQIEEIDLQTELAKIRGDTVEPALLLSQLYRPMAHELFLDVPSNCWVRGGGVNIELSGNLWLYKDPNADPTINGEIRVARGEVQFLGRELRVSEGSVRFEGPITDPTLDITATLPRPPAQVREITAHMTGSLARTQVDVTGQWADGREMTTDEILFALLGSMNLLRSDTVTAATKVEGMFTTAASSQVSGLVGQWTGLDVFEFRPGTGGLADLSSGSLEVGTYVTDRLFVRVLQPIQATQVGQEVSVEYRVLDWLKLRAQQTGRESSALDLLFQIDWR